MRKLSFRFAMACCGVLALALNGCGGGSGESAPRPRGAATFSILDNFSNQNDGANPSATVIMDSQGSLFGSTRGGGSFNRGTVFKLSRDANGYTKTLLHEFSGSGVDGASPLAALLMDSQGNLFGTTQSGGSNGLGTVFKLSFSGNGYTPSTLYSFAGGADGESPRTAVIMDSAGNLYGTTENGGSHSKGTVFKLSLSLSLSGNSYSESILHHFAGGAGGANPWGGLVMDSEGNLYGTTLYGGGDEVSGTVYKLTKQTAYTHTPLHVFQGGENPRSTLIMDSAGYLYGTSAPDLPTDNNGLVFKLSRNSSSYAELAAFALINSPGKPYAELVMDSAGNLYGTTCRTDFRSNFGTDTVFKLSPGGSLLTLYTFGGSWDPTNDVFTAGTDGGVVIAGLVMDSAGNLYGTASQGGANSRGTVFKLGN